MKVAITGGSGFLGKNVVSLLKNTSWTPIVFSRIENSLGDYVMTDYSKENLIKVLKGFDAVVHLAGTRSVKGRIEAYHSDQIISQNLYEACIENNIKKVIFASSISVYSDESLLEWSEVQIPNPVSFYGMGKYAIEMIGNFYSAKKLLNVVNLRFAHLFGANEQNNYMINLFMRLSFNKKQILLNTSSTEKREFLYVNDASKAILSALNHTHLSGTFNIGSDSVLTNYEVATKINQVFGNDGNLKIKNPKAPDTTTSSYMNHSIAQRDLGFKADYTFEKALEEIYLEMKRIENVPIFY